MRGFMTFKRIILATLAVVFLMTMSTSEAKASQATIGLTIFMGLYTQCNGGDSFPFNEMLVGKEYPASELYPRTKSAQAVEKCIFERTKLAVKFPNSIDNKNYFSRSRNTKHDAKTPEQMIAIIDEMATDSSFWGDPKDLKKYESILGQLDNDSEAIREAARQKVAEKMGVDINEDINSSPDTIQSQSAPQNDSVQPEKKKKYIYVPSR